MTGVKGEIRGIKDLNSDPWLYASQYLLNTVTVVEIGKSMIMLKKYGDYFGNFEFFFICMRWEWMMPTFHGDITFTQKEM